VVVVQANGGGVHELLRMQLRDEIEDVRLDLVHFPPGAHLDAVILDDTLYESFQDAQ
jgi:hypothetical protein